MGWASALSDGVFMAWKHGQVELTHGAEIHHMMYSLRNIIGIDNELHGHD